jgi:polyphosphate kinase
MQELFKTFSILAGMEQEPNVNTVLPRFFDRDISWLSFNERVLMEAEKENIPLVERLKFLAIYSSNLDEFYRVRIPSIMALDKFNHAANQLLTQIEKIIKDHQNRYGLILIHSIIPALSKNGIEFLYNDHIPDSISTEVNDIFFTKVAGCLQVMRLSDIKEFFPENNKIYFVVILKGTDDLFIVNIPSDSCRRFHKVMTPETMYIIMIDDIVRQHLPVLFGETEVLEAYAFKITRDAELNLKDEVGGTITTRLEKLLAKRDYGLATRLLYDESMPEGILKKLVRILKLKHATKVAGGRYHNLRDFFSFPLSDPKFCYAEQKPIRLDVGETGSVCRLIDQGDVMLHTPYHSYNLILRFFNESAIDPAVEKIYVSLYRIAVDSAIGQALMTAARNGKKVTVLVELKARFDEANNIRWAKKMKAAGVRICYSSPSMKVHAKVALVKKRKADKKARYYGLFSTGNFNENTARLYTDHILLTSHPKMLKEVQSLFKILMKGKKPFTSKENIFTELIVAPFNIRERFSDLIDREIDNARSGRRAGITIKLNNLEEETLINKLYEASSAGVRIELIVRSICRLIPGAHGHSENITVRRIVDRYLEHGRVFIFHNDGKEEVFCGSADWMNRNIYHRIEVCFPIHDEKIREEIKTIIALQRADTAQAVCLREADGEMSAQLADSGLAEIENVPLTPSRKRKVRSQEEIYALLASSHQKEVAG